MGIAGIDSVIEKIKSGKFAIAEEKSEKISDTNEKNPEWESSVAADTNPKPTSDSDVTVQAPKQAILTKRKRRSILVIIFCAKPVGGSGA